MTNNIQFGGFTPGDGTIDFYLRVGSLADSNATLIDFGAGRAGWFEDDTCATRKSIRHLRGRFKQVIAVDIDPAVLTNRSADHTALIEHGVFPVADNSVDVVVCDFVLEHISDIDAFRSEMTRIIKPGGWLCARTPHRFHYASIAATIFKGSLGDRLLNRAQPDRKDIDIFPKHYRLNTLRALRRAFPGWTNRSFIFRTTPAYTFGSPLLHTLLDTTHRLLPAPLSGNIFAFLQKPDTKI